MQSNPIVILYFFQIQSDQFIVVKMSIIRLVLACTWRPTSRLRLVISTFEHSQHHHHFQLLHTFFDNGRT